MRKIVINKCYGGFSLSDEAEQLLFNKATNPLGQKSFSLGRHVDRSDPLLVEVVEELGSKSWGDNAQLKVAEIPEDVSWEIIDYDGVEYIAEKHRKWYY